MTTNAETRYAIDPATTKATYSNGILDVTVQKLDQSDSGVKIVVE